MPTTVTHEHDGHPFLTVVRRRVWLILACMVALSGAAVSLSLSQEKAYSASASLLFRDPALDQKLFGSSYLAPSSDPAREAATNVELVSLDAVARRVAARPGIGLTPDALEGATEVQSQGQSDVVTITVTRPDAVGAARLANAFAREYIAFRRDADRSKVREAQALVDRQLEKLPDARREGPDGASLRERAEQLQILGALQTGNAELVQAAEPPSSPSAPRPKRNAALGLVMGLLLGLGLAFLLERIDRRLRNPNEAEAMFGRPVLAAIPRLAGKRGRSGQLGVQLETGAGEAFHMLRTNLRYFNVDRTTRSVLVTSSAPAEGKTTIAWNLAVAAAAAGTRTILIEGDIRKPTLMQRVDVLQPSGGLVEVLAGAISMEDAIQSVAVSSAAEGGRSLDVLPAGPPPPNPADLVESDRMREVLRAAERSYDLVVVDAPPATVVSDAIPLMKAVDGVLVAIRLGRTSRDGARQLQSQLEHLNASVIGIVINGVERSSGYYGYGYGYGGGSSDDGHVTVAPEDSAPVSRQLVSQD